MKSTTLLSLAWAAQSAYSLSIHERDEPATLQFNFERRQIADRSRRKRSTASADLVNLVCSHPESQIRGIMTVANAGF